jgi:ion channel POLLUX/CASTOR
MLQYKLEEMLTWSLVGQAVLLWGLFFAVVGVGGYFYQRYTGFGVEKAVWRSWCALSGAEPDFSEDPIRAKIVVTLLTILQFLFFAFLLSAVESGMARKIGELKGGRTQVYERGHDVILGWNGRLPRVLRQIAIAAQSNNERVRVVVLADEAKEMMDAKIKEFVTRGEFKDVTIINRSGDPTSRADQELVAIGAAKKVLILSGGESGDDKEDAAVGDSLAFKTALALKHGAAAEDVRTVVESRSAGSAEMDEMLGPGVTQLLWPDLASRHIVKAALQPSGLVNVHRELLDFEGHELYTRGFPELEGRRVDEACLMLRDSVLVGIMRKSGDVLLNPKRGVVIENGDEIVLLAESKLECRLVPSWRETPATALTPLPPDRRDEDHHVAIRAPRRNILILGWRAGMSKVLDEIDGTVGARSRVSIVAEMHESERHAALHNERYDFSQLRNVRISNVVADPCSVDDVSKALRNAGRVDSVIVLLNSASPARNNHQRESRVLESLVSLRMGLGRRKCLKGASHRPKIVAEFTNLETELLAKADNPGIDAVSLDEFSALLLAQAAYEPQTLSTIRTLLSRDGPELALRSPDDLFLKSEKALSFDRMLRRGRVRRETVLGYISDVDGAVVFNPPKYALVQRSAVRHLVCVVEDIYAVPLP